MQIVLWQQMMIDMDVTYDELNYGVAFNSAGLAIGCFVFIPLTRKYGSRPCYILSTGLMAAVAWWSGRMTTVTEMYITNFLFGLTGSINETISEITVSGPSGPSTQMYHKLTSDSTDRRPLLCTSAWHGQRSLHHSRHAGPVRLPFNCGIPR